MVSMTLFRCMSTLQLHQLTWNLGKLSKEVSPVHGYTVIPLSPAGLVLPDVELEVEEGEELEEGVWGDATGDDPHNSIPPMVSPASSVYSYINVDSQDSIGVDYESDDQSQRNVDDDSDDQNEGKSEERRTPRRKRRRPPVGLLTVT